MWLVVCLTIDPSSLLISYLMLKKEVAKTFVTDFVPHITLNDMYTFT